MAAWAAGSGFPWSMMCSMTIFHVLMGLSQQAQQTVIIRAPSKLIPPKLLFSTPSLSVMPHGSLYATQIQVQQGKVGQTVGFECRSLKSVGSSIGQTL